MLLQSLSLPFPPPLPIHPLHPPTTTHPLKTHLSYHRCPPISVSKQPSTINTSDDEMVIQSSSSDEDEEGEYIPLQEMGRWLKNKPAGFGEGKSYDTEVEERLMEEIERGRVAQAANNEKLKRDGDKKDKEQKDTIQVPTGTRVRVSNLPRKMKIQRDLQLAFKGFQGILKVNPAVIGTRKTRDPVCKGFAFIDLVSEEVANRFVQKYTKQSVSFGKVQKIITCNVVVSTETNEEISKDSQIGDRSRISIIVDDQPEEVTVPKLKGTNRLSSQVKVITTTIKHLSDTTGAVAENLSNGSSSSDSVSSQKKETQVMPKKKKKVKSKLQKVKTLGLPASMVRLNVKERSVLTGVFSKYGGKVVPELSKTS